MVKKIKLLLLASACSLAAMNVVYANAVPYVGASVGVLSNTSDLNIVNNSLIGGNFRGVPASVFVGYGGVVNQNFYLAGEAFATLATGTLSDYGLKSTYGYGLSIQPGIMLSDHTLAYLRAGVLQSRFTSQGELVTGGQFGFGLQTSLTQNVDIRGEYNYGLYRSVTDKTAVASGTITPHTDQFALGMIYKFD